MTLTDRLDDLMAVHSIKSKAELARLAGIPYTTIDGLYKKGSENVTLKTLRRLCAVFGVSLDYLADGSQTEADAAVIDLMDAASGCDRDDIRRAADQLRKLKALKEQNARLAAYLNALRGNENV